MDPKISNENSSKLDLCKEAALKLLDLSSNAANVQELKDSKLLHRTYRALIDIWEEAQEGPIADSSPEWIIGCKHINSSINLIGQLAKQLDEDKTDFQEVRTQNNIQSIFIAIKTIIISIRNLQFKYQNVNYSYNPNTIKQLILILDAILCLFMATHILLNAKPQVATHSSSTSTNQESDGV